MPKDSTNSEMTLEHKVMLSTMRAMHMIIPKNEREAELMSIAYIGAMGRMDMDEEEITKIAIGITKGYEELLKLAMKKE